MPHRSLEADTGVAIKSHLLKRG